MDEALLNRLVDEVVEEQKSMADLEGASMAEFLYGFADKVRAAALEEAAKACEEHGREACFLVMHQIDDNPREVVARECAAYIRSLASQNRPELAHPPRRQDDEP